MQTKPLTADLTPEQAEMIKITSQSAALAQHLHAWPETLDYDAVLAAITSPDGVPDDISVYDPYDHLESDDLVNAIDEAYTYLEASYTNLLAGMLKDTLSAYHKAAAEAVNASLSIRSLMADEILSLQEVLRVTTAERDAATGISIKVPGEGSICELTLSEDQKRSIKGCAEAFVLNAYLDSWPESMDYFAILDSLESGRPVPEGFAGPFAELAPAALAKLLEAAYAGGENGYVTQIGLSLQRDYIQQLKEELDAATTERDAAVKALGEARPRHPDLSYDDLAAAIIDADDRGEDVAGTAILADMLREGGFSGSTVVAEEVG